MDRFWKAAIQLITNKITTPGFLAPGEGPITVNPFF
jgi:hypothetical protein